MCVSQVSGLICWLTHLAHALFAVPIAAGHYWAGYAVYMALAMIMSLSCAWLVLAFQPYAAGGGIPEVSCRCLIMDKAVL